MDAEKEARRAGWRLMREAVRPYHGWVALGVGAGVLWTAAKVTVPLLAAAAIDEGILAHDNEKLVLFTALMVAVGLVQAVNTGLRRYAAFRMALRVETDLRDRLFAHLQRLHFAFHDEAQTGQLMARANTDIQQVHLLVVLVPLFTASVLTLIAVIVILLTYSWVLTVLALGALPFLNIAAARFTRRIQPLSLQLQEELADVSNVVEESVSGIRAVKGFGAEPLQSEQLDNETESVRDRALASARERAWFLPLLDFLPIVGLVAILWYGGHLVLDGSLQIGDLVAFNSYVLMLIWPMRLGGMLLAQAPRAAASGGRVHEVLATDPAVADPDRPQPLTAGGTGEVRFSGVSFGYGTGAPVLAGLDLVVRGGEAVALVGPTGSGKTTVARLVPRFYDVEQGSITIDGVDVRDVGLRELRRAVGIVFEDTFLFSDSVRENIAFADPEASMDAVREAARRAGADEFVQELPEGYDTVVGEHGYSLSGGQRQRIAIARTILASPRVLILDDATSSVDPTKEHEIRAALRDVMRGRTTLIIAHRPATIALADRVVLLDRGRVLAEGTHDELLESSESYREVLAQAAVHAASTNAVPAAGGAGA
jgi:ATP-binding cassette subfamily B protein